MTMRDGTAPRVIASHNSVGHASELASSSFPTKPRRRLQSARSNTGQISLTAENPPFAASPRFLSQASTSVSGARPTPSISASATKTDSKEFRARFRSLYDGREDFFRMKEPSMRPTKKRFVSDDRIDAILIGTSLALMILLVIVAV